MQMLKLKLKNINSIFKLLSLWNTVIETTVIKVTYSETNQILNDKLIINIIIISFIVQCWTQASKPEPLK